MDNDYYTGNDAHADGGHGSVDDYIGNIDMDDAFTHRSIPKQHVESYSLGTNMTIVPYVDIYDRNVPGLFDVLMAHQDNPTYPYSVMGICVRFKSAADAKPTKHMIPFEDVDDSYDEYSSYARYGKVLWMIEVCGGQNHQDKYVLRNWADGKLEIAVFANVTRRRNGDIAYETADSTRKRYSKLLKAICSSPTDEQGDGAEEAYDDDDGAVYETPDYQPQAVTRRPPRPSSSTGIVPAGQGQGSPYEEAVAPHGGKDAGTGTSSIVRSAISLVLFGVQAFVAYMVTHLSMVTTVFGVLTVLSLITLIVSIARHSARANGEPASLTFPKVMSTILIVIAIIELVALVAVLVMYRMHALPGPLQFLYTTL